MTGLQGCKLGVVGWIIGLFITVRINKILTADHQIGLMGIGQTNQRFQCVVSKIIIRVTDQKILRIQSGNRHFQN